jgi:hypothetical protein
MAGVSVLYYLSFPVLDPVMLISFRGSALDLESDLPDHSAEFARHGDLDLVVVHESFAGLTLGTGIPSSGEGSSGWTTSWSGEGTTDSRYRIVDPIPELSYQISGGGMIQGGNRALQLSTGPEPVPVPLSATRSFLNQNTTMYFSCLMRVPASGTGSDAIEIHFLKGNSVAKTMKFTPTNPSPPIGFFGLFTAYGGQSRPVYGDSSQSQLIVVKLGQTDRCDLWIDPDYNSYNSPFISSSGGLATFDGIKINISSTDSAGPATTVILDEIRIGYTWNDAVPPGPAPVLLPDVHISKAVKLAWQTQTGKNYTIQYSYDLTTWFNLGSSISGDNQFKEVFDSTNDDEKKFYRIQVK